MDSRNYTLILHTDGPIPRIVGQLLSGIRTELLTFTYPPAGSGPVEALLNASTDPHTVAVVVRRALASLGPKILSGRLVYDTDQTPNLSHDLYCHRRAGGCTLPPHSGPCTRPEPPISRDTVVHVTLPGGLGPYRATITGYQVPDVAHRAGISRRELLRLGDDLHTAGRGQLHLADDGSAVITTCTAEDTPDRLRLDRDEDGLFQVPPSWAWSIRPVRTRPAFHGLTFRRAHVRRPDLADAYPALLIQPEHRGVVPWLSHETLLHMADDLYDTSEQYDGGGGDLIVMTNPAAVVFRVDHDLHDAGPITILRPNRLGLYPTGRTQTVWTAQPTAAPPLTVATVTAADTGIEVEAFVPRDSPTGQPVIPLLTVTGATQLAAALDTHAAGGNEVPARLTVTDHAVRLHTPGVSPAGGSIIRPDGFGLRTVHLHGWAWHRTT
jgi:hypothetical protein